MNAIGEIFVALSLFIGSGYAVEKIYVAVEREALIHAHRGLPSLSAYTSRLTCSKIDNTGAWCLPVAVGAKVVVAITLSSRPVQG